ncbi:MAG: queuine tRNA-ribosyltransferase family protein [Anaerolineae bacterium]|nr:queuine tRNA-ribosyltransferase family protein [Anaerolineae bacterium]
MASSPLLNSLALAHGTLDFPVFLPDATRGVVRAVDSGDLERCGVTGLVMSTFHLMQRPGSSVIQRHGGLHDFANWHRPIVTDSGGFQVYSLVRQNPKSGSLSEKGMVYRAEDGSKYNLSPEKSIQLQVSYGGDIVFCLDDCTHVDDAPDTQLDAVRRTIKWAKRCREEFDRLIRQKQPETRPLLFAVVQGGGVRDLRRRCADELLEIGFDGYGYGGYPLDGEGNLVADIFAYLRELIPPQYPIHALGVGHPQNVVDCFRLGYSIFDSALPTRDARKGRLYRFTGQPGIAPGRWFEYVYIEDKKHIRDTEPISPYCDCAACSGYSLGYLHHLYHIGDALYMRLATIHNLRFMNQLIDVLRQHG